MINLWDVLINFCIGEKVNNNKCGWMLVFLLENIVFVNVDIVVL